MTKSIAILIPSTSNGRDWKSHKDTYLYSITIRSFLMSISGSQHRYTFYIGLDRGDKVLDTEEFKGNLMRLTLVFLNVSIKFYYMDNVAKGHLTVMWNRLFAAALADQCDYFYQCGDDIEFKTKGWVEDCIGALEASPHAATMGGGGLTGPINNNSRILTQSFVSRKHFDLFGYYFPEELKNWFCDDWINETYRGLGAYYPLGQHYCANMGGTPRYVIEHMRPQCTALVQRDIARAVAKLQV